MDRTDIEVSVHKLKANSVDLTMTRKEARDLIDFDLPQPMLDAFDEAQGQAEDEPAYIIIKITPGPI
jgi:hypothetical protein